MLKEKRMRLGFNQAEIAELIGVTSQAYNQYETCRRFPKIEILQAMITELDISKEELFDYINQFNHRKDK